MDLAVSALPRCRIAARSWPCRPALSPGVRSFRPTLMPPPWDRFSRSRPGSIEHLLIGTGREFALLDEGLRQLLRKAGIRPEPMPTGAAARTYSILLGEKRRVAAALLAVP